MEFKANIGDPKTGKTYKKDIVGDEAKFLQGKRIGEKIKGDKIGFSGYEFELTGGSDKSGFPMRKDVRIAGKRRILIASGVGTRHNRNGMRIRKTVAGGIVGINTVQLNFKILTYGKQSLDAPVEAASAEEAPAAEAAAPAEQAKEEKPKEEVKEESKPEAEESPKEKENKEDAPAEEKPAKEEKKE